MKSYEHERLKKDIEKFVCKVQAVIPSKATFLIVAPKYNGKKMAVGEYMTIGQDGATIDDGYAVDLDYLLEGIKGSLDDLGIKYLQREKNDNP